MRFRKAHAYGNDFLYVEAASVTGAHVVELAREMCHRHTGIGADGLIVYERHGGISLLEVRDYCSTGDAAFGNVLL